MRHTIFGISVDDISLKEVNERLLNWIRGRNGKMIVTPNPEFILISLKDNAFLNLLQNADLSVADGVGLRFAISALTKGKLIYRHTGVDLVEILCGLAEQERVNVVLFGGSHQMADRARDKLLLRFPCLKLFSIDPGYVKGNAEEIEIRKDIIEKVRIFQPAILIVALGQGKQERCVRYMLDHISELKIAIGVGGAFETICGSKPRAPVIFRNSGLEWIWRLLIEPKRIGRIFDASIIFPIKVVSATLKQHIFLKAIIRTIPEIWNQLRNK